MKTIIVGGVAGGMSAATRLRRLDEQAEIVVFERGAHVSYANCGLPYYVGGVIPRREALLLQTPESLDARFRLDVRTGHEVTGIDGAAKTVTVRRRDTGAEFTESYDHLVLSLGAAPFTPPLPGVERALTLRDVTDVDALAAATDTALTAGRRATVIGAGFIGVEVAENLAERGLSVTLVELADQVLPPLDPEMAWYIAEELIGRGIELRLGTQATAIGEDHVTLSDGTTVSSDLVLLSIGVRPETRLARAAGITIGDRGGVVLDAAMRTNLPQVYAVGDMVEKTDVLTGAAALVPLANVANKQGRRAADAIAGLPVPESSASALGTAVVKVFDLTAAATGASGKRLRAEGRQYVSVHIHPAHHAGYYPGARQMHLKMLMDPVTGAILGAQGVGAEGVERRIDVLATAIAGGLTGPDLIDLELAYAPPYGSAKDPVNMLGYLADNILAGEQVVSWNEVGPGSDPQIGARHGLLIDVRTPAEFAKGTIPGSVNIPVDELRARHEEIPPGHNTVFCQVGQRGHVASRMLGQLGHDVANLSGGWLTWSAGQKARALASGRRP
ncbi:MAG: FAD-dependent oxidoreductase [Austwickia sp.]|nr:FAD-dependent oxidoreductase [Austwickia sp.]